MSNTFFYTRKLPSGVVRKCKLYTQEGLFHRWVAYVLSMDERVVHTTIGESKDGVLFTAKKWVRTTNSALGRTLEMGKE